MTGPSNPPELAVIQRWMQSVIMHPQGVNAGITSAAARAEIDVAPEAVEEVIRRSTALTSIERLHVYANAYYARLLEVLASEFPALVHALGAELFQEFAYGYLQHYPSQDYTLAELGSHFRQYLADTRPPPAPDQKQPDWADFLVDLAALERCYSEVFDGPGIEGQPLLQPDDLQGLDAADWPQSRLVTVPCLKLLALRFPVHEYATAARQGAAPPIVDPRPTWLVVTRRDYVVRRVAISEAEFAALSMLVNRGTVAEALEAAAARWPGDFEQLVGSVQSWFRDWAAAGYFQGIEAPTPGGSA